MRYQTSPFLLHVAVGFAAIGLAFTSAPIEPFRPAFLFIVGVPWFAGFLAFYGLPRTHLAWTLPMVPLILGLMIWLLAVGLSGLAS
jgi:hypothetical protein